MDYPEFLSSVTSSFLEGALWKYYGTVLEGLHVSPSGINIGRGVLKNYIKENGADRLVNSFRNKTYALSEINRLVLGIKEGCKDKADPENPDTFNVSPEDEQKFYDELSNNDNFDDITNAIRMRVIDAEEKMSTDSIQDKIDSDNILNSAAERIKSVKAQNAAGDMADNIADAITAEAASIANVEANKITTNRPRCVLEHFVRNMSTRVLSDGTLHESYTSCGNINYEKLIESCTVIYTFMEMLNTMKIEEFDENYILELVK